MCSLHRLYKYAALCATFVLFRCFSTGGRAWTRDECSLVDATATEAACECLYEGVYAVTTDMYDVNVGAAKEIIITITINTCRVLILSSIGLFVSVSSHSSFSYSFSSCSNGGFARRITIIIVL